MGEEIELISDGEGFAVVGKQSDVEAFLRARGLLAAAEDFDLHKLGGLAQVADAVIGGVSEIAAQSGRWIKLTKESAELVKEFGLMETKTRGVRHAMIGDPGSINKWLQIDTSTGALLSNPAVLAGAAGVMAQMARQREMRDIKAYLGQIDTKISDVLRAQKDAEVARLFGARRSIERALSIREEQGGRTDPTTWSTVQDRVGVIDDLLSWAIISLERAAARVNDASQAGERAKLARAAEDEVAELLAVIASCFELQDALDVLRLDRVLEESPDIIDDQRRALQMHRQDRRLIILEGTRGLVAQVDEAAATGNSHVLLHGRAASSVTRSANEIGEAVAEFREPLGIETLREGVETPGLMEALRDGRQLQNASKEAGPKLAVSAVMIGGLTLYAIPATRPMAIKAFETARRIVKSIPS